MNEEGRPYDEQEFSALARRFEGMVSSGAREFFDADELDGLLDFYMEHREERKARAVLKYAEELFPGNPTFKLRTAQLLSHSGQHVKAIPVLREVLALEPTNDEAWATLGGVYSQMQEHRLAIQHFRKALEWADDEMKQELLLEIALEHENLGEWHRAIRCLREAVDQQPENETALYELAFCFDKVGSTDTAIAYFRAHLEAHPYAFAAWYSLGNALLTANQYLEAIDAYDFAIAIEGGFGPAYHQKAEALLALERFGEAFDTYKETLDFEPASPATTCYMGECLERMGSLESAEAYYRECLDLDPTFSEAYLGLGALADARGDVTGSIAFYERSIALDPDLTEGHILLGNAQKKLGFHSLAEPHYIRALELEPAHIDAWYEWVDNRQRTGDHAGALALIEDGLKALGGNGDLMYRKFISLLFGGSPAAAYELLEHLLHSDFEGADVVLTSFPELRNDVRFMQRYAHFRPAAPDPAASSYSSDAAAPDPSDAADSSDAADASEPAGSPT